MFVVLILLLFMVLHLIKFEVVLRLHQQIKHRVVLIRQWIVLATYLMNLRIRAVVMIMVINVL